jgi:hypothetical protein
LITSAEEFVRLRASVESVEYQRAANEEAPLAVWQDVIARFPDYRQWVAHNKTVPMEILEILATDPDPDVRYTVASKRKLTPKLLTKLANDPDDSVRNRVVRHKHAPHEVLEALRSDPWDAIRAVAEERLSGSGGAGP